MAVAEVVDAALAALDPYTRPVWSAGRPAWELSTMGTTGVGMMIEDHEHGVFVDALLEGGPAFLANVHVGDQILALDGQAYETAAEARGHYIGAIGTTLTVTTDRGVFELVRRMTDIPSVTGWRRRPSRPARPPLRAARRPAAGRWGPPR